MTDNQDQIPQWVLRAREDIQHVKHDVHAIRIAGQADIQRGLETVKAADKRLQEISYLEQVLNQGIPASSWQDEIVHATGMQLGGSIAFIRNDTHRLVGLYGEANRQEQATHTYLSGVTNSTGITSGSIVYMGAQIERRLQVVAPTYTPVLETSLPEQIGTRQQTYQELAEILNRYEPKYIHMLKGSETALRSTAMDNLSQAAHSMRDLFQQIIENLAPANAVKQQPWFKPTSNAPGGVSRMSRLRYILYGSGEMLDEREIERLNDAAERAKDSLDLAMARAHDHDPDLTEAEVELAIDHARFSLLQVLKRYSMRRNWDTV